MCWLDNTNKWLVFVAGMASTYMVDLKGAA